MEWSSEQFAWTQLSDYYEAFCNGPVIYYLNGMSGTSAVLDLQLTIG